MSQPPSPSFYRVIPSGRVSAELKALFKRAQAVGLGWQVLDALKALHRVLSVYPQFGEPVRDLKTVQETIYVASFPPLFVEYVIDEPRREVVIGIPFKVMPNSGFE